MRFEREMSSLERSTTMEQLRLLILPTRSATRLIARSPSGATLLKASLPSEPWHSQALPRLLEGLGSFAPLRAALVVPAREPSFATSLYPGWFIDVGGANYDLDVIGTRRRDRLEWWGRRA
jgi:hypothetical protein